MSVQDYELLLRVRADLNQALGGLDNLKKKLGDGSAGAEVMAKSGDKATASFGKLKTVIAAIGIAKLVKDYFSAADAASNAADTAKDAAKAAKKAGASAERGGNGYANKPTGSVPQSAAPKNSVVVAPGRHVPKISFTHEKNAYTPDNGDKYIAQLNGFLKNGIIERSEYNYLLKKYRNNYTK